METSVLSKTSLFAGPAWVTIAVILAVAPIQACASILLQTNSGVWVNGSQFASGFQTMPGIVLAPDVRDSGGFMRQRALAWASYRRADRSTGLLLVDPTGNGAFAATSPRQANVRANVARANAYRLEYFKK